MTRSGDFASGEDDPLDYQLAERLHMTVGDLRRRMTTAEKAGWIAFDRYRRARRDQQDAAGQLEIKANERRRQH